MVFFCQLTLLAIQVLVTALDWHGILFWSCKPCSYKDLGLIVSLFSRSLEPRFSYWNLIPCSLVAAPVGRGIVSLGLLAGAGQGGWREEPRAGGPAALTAGAPCGTWAEDEITSTAFYDHFQQGFSLPFEYVAQLLLLKCVLLLYDQNALSLIFHCV